MRLFLAVICLLAFGCKNPFKANYTGSESLQIEGEGMQPIGEVTNTPTAGEAAARLGYSPSGGSGTALTSGSQSIKEGTRVCISSSYGKDSENAVLCGRAKQCSSFEGLQGKVKWEPGELCMRADCLSKSTNGLDAPGSGRDGSTPCAMEQGRATLFSLTEYQQYVNRFALAVKSQETNTSGEVKAFYGDKFYQKTSASQGPAKISLGGEMLHSGNIMLVQYNSSGLGLNGPSVDSTAKVGYTKEGVPMFYEFSEGGFAVNSGGGGSANANSQIGIDTRGGSAPTNTQLGLVTTRRGNTYALDGSGGVGLYGAEGSAKLYLESK